MKRLALSLIVLLTLSGCETIWFAAVAPALACYKADHSTGDRTVVRC